MIKFINLKIFILFSTLTIYLVLNSRLGKHGFIIVQDQYHEDEVYLSHIPMFNSPQDFQILLKAKTNKILNLQLNHYYTAINNLEFDLDKLLSLELKSITLNVFDGNLNDEKLIHFMIVFNIENIIYKKQLNKTEIIKDYPSYVVFGGKFKHCGQGYYNLLHVIEGKDNFDHVLQVTLALDNNYEDGSILNLKTAKNNLENKIKPGIYYEGDLLLENGEISEVTVYDVIQYSCLKGPIFDIQCEEDNKIGFLEN